MATTTAVEVPRSQVGDPGRRRERREINNAEAQTGDVSACVVDEPPANVQSVPNVEFFGGIPVKSLTRFGGAGRGDTHRAACRERRVTLDRRRKVLRAGRAEALSGARRSAVRVNEDEVRGVVVGVLRRRPRALAEGRD